MVTRDTDWKPLCQELGIDKPTPEYQILQIATVRIQTLRELVETEKQDVIKTAHEVLPDASLHFAHQPTTGRSRGGQGGTAALQ